LTSFILKTNVVFMFEIMDTSYEYFFAYLKQRI
jgi:hypothetical protein